MALVEATRSVADIEVDRFDAIVVAGGQSPMFPCAAATDLDAKFVACYTAGKIAATPCHGTAVLNYAQLPNGDYLVKGKTVMGFANGEEDFAAAV